MKSCPLSRPNSKLFLLLLWIFCFVGFNGWFFHLSSMYDARIGRNIDLKGEVVRVDGGVRKRGADGEDSFWSNEIPYDDKRPLHAIEFESLSSKFDYDDDNPHAIESERGENESIPQWQEETEDYESTEPSAFSLKDLHAGKKGKIAWLMSFPNSGTSFTSLLIRHASNATTASNYGMEGNPGIDGKSVPVYDWSWRGPYWLHPPTQDSSGKSRNTARKKMTKQFVSASGTESGKSGSYNIPPKGASIMTKTHCGSRCTFCPPEKYLETWQSFLIKCLSGSRSIPVTENKDTSVDDIVHANVRYRKEYVTYHPSLVEKAVHLIRNPFDNLVSRFHHEQKEHKKRLDTKWTGRYSNDAYGFRKWCADEDLLFRSKEQMLDWEALGYETKKMKMHFEGVACHAEFFRYMQWHNLAMRAVEIMELHVIYVHYEDYTTDLEGVTGSILEFLNLPRVGSLPTFYSNKDYSDYFSLEERAAASELMRVLASDACRRLIERYWVELDFGAMRKQIQAILD